MQFNFNETGNTLFAYDQILISYGEDKLQKVLHSLSKIMHMCIKYVYTSE